MNIKILSDLHLIDPIKASELDPVADVLVLAGDIALHDCINKVLCTFCSKYKNVIFVPGNHEFYGTSIEQFYAELVELDNLHTLREQIIIIDGIRFVGTTLWFPESCGTIQYRSILNDFNWIKAFNPGELNDIAQTFLLDTVRPGDVVVTHHAPSIQSVEDRYKNSPFNCFFISDQENLIINNEPRLWIHGHVHNLCNYNIGNTMVVCKAKEHNTLLRSATDQLVTLC